MYRSTHEPSLPGLVLGAHGTDSAANLPGRHHRVARRASGAATALRYCFFVPLATDRAPGGRRKCQAEKGHRALAVLLVSSLALSQAARSGAAAATKPRSCSPAQAPSCPWATAQYASLYTPGQLAGQVLAQMTLAEKIGIVELDGTYTYENENTGIPSLCIPTLTLQDGPNGLAYGDTGVTQLPASIATAATFDPSLANEYGQVLGSQAHTQGIDVVQGPNLNLVRVPDSGRTFETFGEDPDLSSVMAVAEIDGIQSHAVMAEAKHYAAYTQETARVTLNQQVSLRAFEEVYAAPFRAAVQSGHVAAIMCAFGLINGVYVCQSPAVLNILKKQLGFTGFVRSDDGAVTNPVAAFDAGMDMIKPPPANLGAEVTSGAIPSVASTTP